MTKEKKRFPASFFLFWGGGIHQQKSVGGNTPGLRGPRRNGALSKRLFDDFRDGTNGAADRRSLRPESHRHTTPGSPRHFLFVFLLFSVLFFLRSLLCDRPPQTPVSPPSSSLPQTKPPENSVRHRRRRRRRRRHR